MLKIIKKITLLLLSVLLLTVLNLFISSCNKKNNRQAESIELISGNNQTAEFDDTLTNPIIVLVRDQYGDAYERAIVNFSISEGHILHYKVTTVANGEAENTWILGPTAGTQILTITAFKQDSSTALTGSPLVVKATATALNPQTTFGPKQVLSTNTSDAISIYACDIDGDGDNDILSASQHDNNIVWYENTDGTGIFSSMKVITNSTSQVQSIYACDIDGDGDNDVISASQSDSKIAWYENTDGNGNFASQQIISTSAINAGALYAEDIDGDGDYDVLTSGVDEIIWYENTDGNGNFGEQHSISCYSTCVYACDIDRDGDYDVISASFHNDEISWFENTDGNGNFGPKQIITTSADGIKSIYASDIDGDGDMDLLSASDYDDKIAWYENTDGLGLFGLQQIITTSADGANKVHATDLDGDGDFDVLSTSGNDSKTAWYENTNGLGNFGEQQIITTHTYTASCIYACDLDGDGDKDVISSWFCWSENIAWFENHTPIICK